MNKTILIVDDEESICQTLGGILTDEGYEVVTAGSGEEALRVLEEEQPQLILLDIWLPGMDGIETLKAIKAAHPQLQVVMMSGHGTIETALEAIRVGAIDFLEKPIALQKLLKTVMTTMQHGVPPQAQVQALNEDNPQKNMMGDGMVMVPLPLDLPLREARDYFDNAYFNYQIQKESGNISRVAENIGIERTHLYRKLKQLGIKPGKKTIDTSE